MSAYYNEHDPHAAAWLRELIKAGHIANGEVDERSIADVRADDLRGFSQCHFFAGIGGWSRALRLAGWADDRPVWTGSCPCQPFSTAGKQKGTADERHLWPVWFKLISECMPATIFGEQVEAAIRHGWLDLVQADLEGSDYAFGAVGLPAACVGAPHIRQRLWFVADRLLGNANGEQNDPTEQGQPVFGKVLSTCTVADAENPDRRSGISGAETGAGQDEERRRGSSGRGSDGMADASGQRCGETRSSGRRSAKWTSDGCAASPVGNAINERLERLAGDEDLDRGRAEPARPAPSAGFWSDCEWIACRDGKARPVEPGVSPLVNGLPRGVVPGGDPSDPNYANATAEARVMRLRGYGNAIVPQVAAEVIRAFMEVAA